MPVRNRKSLYTIIAFGLVGAAFLILVQLSKYRLGMMMKGAMRIDVLAVLLILTFMAFGFGLHQLFLPYAKAPVPSMPSLIDFREHGLSSREYEVLQKMSKGLSNAGIAKDLFISENTVKTHVSNILQKLNARRRTEAVRIAQDLQII